MRHVLASDRRLAKLIAQTWMDARFCQHFMESSASLLAEAGIAADLTKQALDAQPADTYADAIPAKPADLTDGSINPGFDQVMPLGFYSFCRGSCS